MRWDMHTSCGLREKNEDSVSMCFLRGREEFKEYICDLKCGDKDWEHGAVAILRDNKILSVDGKMEVAHIENEPDAFHIFAVADGLGGHLRGEVASEWAVRSIIGWVFYEFISGSSLRDAFVNSYATADEYIREKAAENAGTTLVMAVIWSGNLYISNIGDSRGYVFKDRKLIRKTKDHTFVQSLVDAGVITEEEAREHPKRNVLLKALGMGKPKPDIYEVGKDWDSFLLCSDGFSNVFSDGEIAQLVTERKNAKEMVQMAIERGSDDNVSVVVVRR